MAKKARTKIIVGKKSRKHYNAVAFEETVGKTIEAVGVTTVPSAYGDEDCIMLFFSDGTKTGFVLPSDN
jgi:hypothetical protein